MPEPLTDPETFFTAESMRLTADLRAAAASGDASRVVELVGVPRPSVLRRALAVAILSESWSDADRAALAGVAA